MILVWKTKEDLERYWKPGGGATDLCNALYTKLEPLHAELLWLYIKFDFMNYGKRS